MIKEHTYKPPDKSAYLKTNSSYSQPNHVVGTQKKLEPEPSQFEHPKHMFKLMGKKIITISR